MQYTFSTIPNTWSNSIFTWSDIQLLEELDVVSNQTGTSGVYDYYNTFNEKKKKRVIKLITKVKNFKSINTKSINDNIRVNISDLKLLLAEYNKIKIFVTLPEEIF